jgi:NRPS condensation-like uncharacterized protein
MDPSNRGVATRYPATVQDLFNYVARLWHDGQIRCVARFDGRLNAPLMARAIRLTLDAEPVLGCRLVENGRRPYFQRLPDLDDRSLCPLMTGGDLDASLSAFLVAPIDPRDGPLVHARIFRGPTGDTLAVKLAHEGGDGAGAMQYLVLLARTYHALQRDPAYCPPPQSNPDRGQGQVFRHIGPLGVLRALPGMRFSTPSLSIAGYGDDSSGRAIALRRVDAARLAAMRDYGRQRGAKVNDLLVAAIYRALFPLLHPRPGQPCLLALPVNLRRYLPPGYPLPVANLSGGNAYSLPYLPGESYDGALARVLAASRGFKAAVPGIGAAAFEALALGPSYAAGRALLRYVMGLAMKQGKIGPFLSNVGVLDESLVNFGEPPLADAYGLGVISFPPNLNVAASTFRGVLTLTSGYCPTAIPPATVESFLDAIIAELPAAP